jgi:hypothetical protein
MDASGLLNILVQCRQIMVLGVFIAADINGFLN